MKAIYPLLAMVVLIAACGGGDTTDTGSQRLNTSEQSAASKSGATPRNDGGYSSSIILNSPDGVEQITWDDLMPEGKSKSLLKYMRSTSPNSNKACGEIK